MTYPQYGAPQYAPPQPGMAPAQYGPPQQPPAQPYPGNGYATVPTVPNPMADLNPDDPFIDPAGGGGSLAPKPRDLVGRTVIIEPLSIDPNAKFEGSARPAARFHLWVVDGPWPLLFGDDKTKGTPHTHKIDGPARFTNVVSSNSGFYAEVEKRLGQGIILGVVEKGDRAFLVTNVMQGINGPRPDGPQRKAAAIELWKAFHSGAWISPQPVELATSGPAGVVSYGPPQQQPPAQPTPYVTVMQQPPQYAPIMSTATGAPVTHMQQLPPQPPAGPQWGPQQPAPVSAMPASGPVPGELPPPPGWEAAWPTYTPEQRAQVYAQMGMASPQ